MRLPSRSLLVTCVCLLLWLCSSACSTQPSSAVGPPPAEIGWARSFLGGAADVVVFARPDGLRRDEKWGPLFRDGNANVFDLVPAGDERLASESKDRLHRARDVELYVMLRTLTFDSARAIGYVAVVRGLPATEPSSLRTESGKERWTAGLRLGSSVAEYRPTAQYAEETHGLAPTIFVTADGTWIAVDEVTSTRARESLTTRGAAPPSLDPPEDVLLGGSLGLTATGFLSAYADKAKTNVTHGLESMGVAVRGGKNAGVEIFGTYSSSSNASAAFDAYEAQCKAGRNCALPAFLVRDMQIEKDGKRLTWRVFPSDALFRTIAETAEKKKN
jgi:hypothetical protein